MCTLVLILNHNNLSLQNNTLLLQHPACATDRASQHSRNVRGVRIDIGPVISPGTAGDISGGISGRQ